MDSLETVRDLQQQLKTSDEDTSKEILTVLKNINMTFEILKETKVAKTIKRIEKKYSSLRYLVRDMIDKWRAIVKTKKKVEEKPIHLEDSRNRVVSLITEAIGNQAIAIKIEEELHKYEKNNYAHKARSLKFNLAKNIDLKESVLSGEITPEVLVRMNPRDMVSEERKEERKKIELELTEGRRSDWHAVHNAPKGGMFKCRKCGSDKTMTQQMQTRSADEPMTT
jgi:DNA-directed RNA polymerase subunit M/transcription elongation factor TFIIS